MKRKHWIGVLAVSIGSLLLVAMVWMTAVGIDLAKRYEQSQQQVRLNEQISSALWRMDGMLAPIIAIEATRPTGTVFALTEQGTLPDENSYSLAYFYWIEPSPGKSSALSQQTTVVNSTTISNVFDGLTWNDIANRLPAEKIPNVQSTTNLPGNRIGDVTNSYIAAGTVPEETPPNQAFVPKNDLNRRSSIYQNSAKANSQGQVMQQAIPTQSNADKTDSNANQANAQGIGSSALENDASPGVIKPMWINQQLILARRTDVIPAGFAFNKFVAEKRNAIQGCILNWETLRADLLREIEDLVPGADLVPRDSEVIEPQRDLAGIPVRLIVPTANIPFRWSPLLIAIAGVWISAFIAFFTAMAMTIGLFRLSEKRASFVSAVTHELRTPLTTFRMYSEMLAKSMVTPEDRPRYLATLCTEADRLSHLIDNVLTYSRLEKNAAKRETIRLRVSELIGAVNERLIQRANQSSMQIAVEIPESTADIEIDTDPASVEQILFNAVDNAAKYATDNDDARIHIIVSHNDKSVHILIADHGPGLDKTIKRSFFLPFSKSAEQAATSKPGVGLGMALSRRLARQLHGDLTLAECPWGRGCGVLLTIPK